jgi:hypothetical protein
MKIKHVLVILFAMSLLAAASHAAAVAACDPNTITVLKLDNRAVKEQDKYWGNPDYFGTTITYMLAFKMMWATGKPVKVADVKSADVMKVQDIPDPDAIRVALGDSPSCLIALGSVDQAVIFTKKSVNVVKGNKKFEIDAKLKLSVVDLAAGATKFSDTYSEEHETSTLIEQLSNTDKVLYFPSDPVEAGGNPLGVPFSRIFNKFCKKVLE